MNKLLEIKDKIIKFYGEYENIVFSAVKFVIAFAAFAVIDLNIGYMTRISSLLVALLLALVCALLPVNAILWIGALLILLDMYALSIEVAATTFVLFVVIYFVYFRFAPKDGILAVLTPIAFQLKIPYIIPIACGLLRKTYSVLAVICGTVLYYFLDGVKQNASALAEVTDKEGGTTTKLNVTIGQLLGNKEMFAVVIIFTLSALVVYTVRRLEIKNAWDIAIAVGALIQFVSLLIVYFMMDLSGKILWLVIGTVISYAIGVIIRFICMDLDYARTERVQFEDDEYYYYVKAVPKKTISSSEKVVKRFGTTASMGKRIPKQNTQKENISRSSIAKDLDVDEDIFKN